MKLPQDLVDALVCVATETANMSYPAAMSRGKKPVVAKGTKAVVRRHLVSCFPMSEVWQKSCVGVSTFDSWHRKLVTGLAGAISDKVLSGNNPESVAAKFLNTFLHQLTKYEEARFLVPLLHVPLDSRVFGKLRTIKSPALGMVRAYFASSPYSLPYAHHLEIQCALQELIYELNARPNSSFQFKYRIELNWLWL